MSLVVVPRPRRYSAPDDQTGDVDREVLTVCDVAAKVLADDDVPGWAVASVELLLDLCSNVLLNVVLLQRDGRDVDRLLLHLLAHINVFDYGLGAGAVDGRGV